MRYDVNLKIAALLSSSITLSDSDDPSHQLPTSSIAADALLAIVVLVCTWSVFIYYAYSSTVGCQVVAAPISFDSNMHRNDGSQQQQQGGNTVYTTDGVDDSLIVLSDSDDDDDDNMLSNNSITRMEWARHRAQLGSFKRFVCYMLEPTHEPSLPILPARIKSNNRTDGGSSREGTPTTPLLNQHQK